MCTLTLLNFNLYVICSWRPQAESRQVDGTEVSSCESTNRRRCLSL